ncbi:cell division and transport-associated protein TolA [Litoreibacter ponti]|uniref:Cell division and transport-associated protein TolA n=1 Tax=Litoreibacter ponti TaxID=1510457 RepID=A0A2T6BLQ6_9RHOB|nr:energy transducer TonB [Litoreibacter ponti]PTX56917.1 cell division and transport-associated protein TolA [Litoreibacter ponti]
MGLRPNTGTYVSGAGHAAFLLYLMVGGLFFARETEMDVSVSNVSIISGEEFAAMQPQSPGSPELPEAPSAPEPDQPAPAVAEEEAPAAPAAPTPLEEVTPDEPPVIEETAPPPAPEPEGDPGASVVEPDAEPTPEAAERVAEEAVDAPDPEVTIDETDQAAVSEDPAETPAVQEDAQEETAREEATTEIVTEADEPSAAPSQSIRPGRKPTPPAPQVAETETPAQDDQPSAPSLQDLINDTVREAASETQEEAVADNANPGGGTGAPITRAEKGAFILGIQRCWNVGALGTDALAVSVVVSFQLDPTAKPDVGSIRMVSSEGGSGSAVDRAYEAARRAIIRCGSNGFDLPLDKYDQWRQVQVSFNASRQEIR